MASEEEILEKIVCDEIPDTRAMQAYRLKAAGELSSGEEFMQKNRTKAWEAAHTITRMPKMHQRQLFRMSIPLAFPSGDYPLRGFDPDEKTPETSYFRWKSSSAGDGAMHITTERNLNKILRIFVRNNLPVKLEPAYGKLLDQQRENGAGIVVPYGWHVETYDPSENLIYHQYVTFDKKIVGIPYWWKSSWVVSQENTQDSYHNTSVHFTSNVETHVTYSCKSAFFCPDYSSFDSKPEKFLQKRLDRWDKERKEFWEDSRNGKLLSSENKLLKIGEPVLIYDPAWIEPGRKNI